MEVTPSPAATRIFGVVHAEVCLVGVLCGSLEYEKPILGSGFSFTCSAAFAVLGDFRRVGGKGFTASAPVAALCTCSSMQVD